jgi:hypothetical protein
MLVVIRGVVGVGGGVERGESGVAKGGGVAKRSGGFGGKGGGIER